MRGPAGVFSAFLLSVVFLRTASAAAPSLPSCALSCLAKALPETPCTLFNTTCICTNPQLNTLVSDCVVANCSSINALTAQNVTAITCATPVRNKQQSLKVTAITMSVVSGFLVIIRLAFRQFAMSGLTADDWCILVMAFAGVPQTYLIIHGLISNGMGRDTWTLPVHNIYSFGRFFYALEMQYFSSMMLIKLSLLLFYLRIFSEKGVRLTLWATIALTVVVSIAFIFLATFQCRPISYFWTRWDGEHTGQCLNINAIGWAHAVFNISMDIWMLAIPLYQLRYLSLQWQKKVGVGLMFCVGTFVTIVSIIRLQTLLTFSNSLNPTWDNAETINWSAIEVAVGIICTCMPTLRLVVGRIFPTMFGGSTARTYVQNPRCGSRPTGQSGLPGKSHHSQTTANIPLASRSRKDNFTTQTTVTLNDPCDANTLTVVANTISESSLDADTPGIMYSKTYAIEFNSEYNDQARLVANSGRSIASNPSSPRGSVYPYTNSAKPEVKFADHKNDHFV